MPKNISKISRQITFAILAITISGLLNVCLFALQAKAAQPIEQPKIHFAYDSGGNCVAEPSPEPEQTINRQSAPMPECCLQQNRNFNAVVNTANDKTATAFADIIILSSNNPIPENNFSYNTSQNIFPPPATSALATTIIRE